MSNFSKGFDLVMYAESQENVNDEGARPQAGYALLSRCLPQHELVGFGRPGTPADPAKGCYSHAEAWVDLILSAAYREREVSTGKSTITLERGELVAPERELASKWNWTYKAVRCFVTKLRAQNMLERGAAKGAKESSRVSVLKICNYDKFQVPQAVSQTSSGRIEGRKTSQTWAQNTGISGKKYINKTIPPYSPPTGEVPLQVEVIQDSTTDKKQTQPQKPPAAEAGFEAWARVASEFGLAPCRSLSEARRSKMAARLKACGGAEAFEAVLRREISHSPFLRGKVTPRPGQRPFKAHVDFVLQRESWDKMVDGFYSGKAPASPPQAPLTPVSTPRATPATMEEIAAHESGMSLEAYRAVIAKAKAEGRVTHTQRSIPGQFVVDFTQLTPHPHTPSPRSSHEDVA